MWKIYICWCIYYNVISKHDEAVHKNTNIGLINNIKTYGSSAAQQDLNNHLTTSIIAVLNALNMPTGSTGGYLLVMIFRFGSDVLQFGIGNSVTSLYRRTYDTGKGTWSLWKKIDFVSL